MKRLLLLLMAVCVGVIGFAAFRRAAELARIAAADTGEAQQLCANRLAESRDEATALRAEVTQKKKRLLETLHHPVISSELLALAESENLTGSPAAWSELRQQLGIGWDSSPSYVLVSKRVLPRLDYQHVLSGRRPSDIACSLLALSPSEQTALQLTLQRVQDGQKPNPELKRTEPSGDIVAQYTFPAPDPEFAQSVSNSFIADVGNILGPERSSLFAGHAWREIKSELGPAQDETLTIRRVFVDGEPDLVYEIKSGKQTWSDPVRYAHYPSGWFLKAFPGGWKTLADREGFELPPRFQNK